MMIKKTRAKPKLSHIFELLAPTVNSGFLKGQLVIEGILLIALRDRLDHPELADIDEINFYRLCGLCASLSLIDGEMLALLRKIGKIRNQMAHQLDYVLEFPEAFELVRQASQSGVDFSDGTISSDQQKSEEWYGVEGIVQELFQNLSQDLIFTFDPNLEGIFSAFYA